MNIETGNSREFRVGNLVEWTSQAQGVWKTKRGTIVQTLDDRNGYLQFVKVSVQPPLLKNGKQSTAKPTMYWPRLSALKLVTEASHEKSTL